MKRLAAVCLLVLSGCATVTASRSGAVAPQTPSEESGGSSGSNRETGASPGPVRLETSAGTFLVNPNNAEDFGRLLAGEPTQHQYYSVTDMP